MKTISPRKTAHMNDTIQVRPEHLEPQSKPRDAEGWLLSMLWHAHTRWDSAPLIKHPTKISTEMLVLISYSMIRNGGFLPLFSKVCTHVKQGSRILSKESDSKYLTCKPRRPMALAMTALWKIYRWTDVALGNGKGGGMNVIWGPLVKL